MPFKGDMRLGGPHDNEANLNGTSSDFDGVPEYGTVLNGPYDTSRYEADYDGTQFYMPYSTIDYANGTGGSYSVETWGLQYLPAGWVTGRYTVPHNVYISAYDVTVEAGYDAFMNVEDGTGINSTVNSQNYRPSDGTLLYGPYGESWGETNSYYDGFTSQYVEVTNGVQRQAAIVYNSGSPDEWGESSVVVSGDYYPDGTYIADQPDSSVEVPSGSGQYFFDGNDNRYEWNGSGGIELRYSGLYPNGTYITNSEGNNYYWNGSGGFYSESDGSGGGNEYPPSGTLLNSSSGTAMVWISEEGSEYPVGSYNSYEYADGTGGSYSTTDYSYIPSGDVIYVSPSRFVSDIVVEHNAGYYNTGKSYFYAYRSNGSGGYYEDPNYVVGEFYPLGTTAYSYNGVSQTFELYVNGNTYFINNGLTTYDYNYVWDGNGSIMEGPTTIGSFYSQWTKIYDEWGNHINTPYEYTDENGDTQYGTLWYFHNGNGGWDTNSSENP